MGGGSAMGDRTIGVDLLGDEADLARALGAAVTKLEEVAGAVQRASGTVNVDTDTKGVTKAKTELDELDRAVKKVDGKRAEVGVNVDGAAGLATLGRIVAILEAVVAVSPIAVAAIGA